MSENYITQSSKETGKIIEEGLKQVRANPHYQQLEPEVQADTDRLVRTELGKIAQEPWSITDVQSFQRDFLEERIPRHLERMVRSEQANEKMRPLWAEQRRELGLEPKTLLDHAVKPQSSSEIKK